MQTFLPSNSYYISATNLDNKRLGKQRVEAFQILRALRGETKGWANHPAVKMWRGYEPSLELYLYMCITVWRERGFQNNMAIPVVSTVPKYPNWHGDPTFHASHRSNLLRKDPVYYAQFGWTEPSDLPYIWPVSDKELVS